MQRDDWVVVLSVICALTGFVGMFFTLSIALGFNRHMGRWISDKFGMYEPDYGEPIPTPAQQLQIRKHRKDLYM